MRLHLGILLAVLTGLGTCVFALAGAKTAERPRFEAVAFDDPWTRAERRALALEEIRTRRCPESRRRPNMRIQDRVIDRDPDTPLRRVLDPRWASMWLDNCDRGRLKVGIVPGPRADVTHRARAVRRVLRRLRLDRDTDLVAVRSTTRQLMDAQDRFTEPLDDLFDRGLITVGRDDEFNAIHVETARTISEADHRRLRRAARRTGVNVYFENTNADDLTVELD